MKKVLLSALALTLVVSSTAPSFAGWWNKNDGHTEKVKAPSCSASRNVASATESMTIAQVAMSKPEFSTLVTALKAAGLAETFMEPGNYTVFAPTNDAFNMLPSGTVEMLLKPENRDKLRELLMYHVLDKRVTSTDLPTKRMDVTTLEGSKASVSKSASGNVTIDDATVVLADVKTNNGVIHAIDRVIMP